MLDETPLAPLGLAGLVFMASGQGSQKPGMGADMLDIPEVASVFACASDVLGRDVAALVRDASPEELSDTRNAQIAIAALSVGMGRALEARGIVPDALLGFSLGQVSAMVLGGMLAGHNESGGEVIEKDGKVFRSFYGMSSKSAMDKYSGGVAKYRAAEGKTVYLEDRGPVADSVQEILGGVRSACTYVGARRLKELTKRTTFVRVTQQLNEVFGKS